MACGQEGQRVPAAVAEVVGAAQVEEARQRVGDFGYSGWNPLAFLAAGQAGGNMNVNWLAGALGLFTDTIIFNGFGTNASDPLGLAQTRQLTIRANVINRVPPGTVPEPGTLALLLGAAAAAGLARRRAVANVAKHAAKHAASGAAR